MPRSKILLKVEESWGLEGRLSGQEHVLGSDSDLGGVGCLPSLNYLLALNQLVLKVVSQENSIFV